MSQTTRLNHDLACVTLNSAKILLRIGKKKAENLGVKKSLPVTKQLAAEFGGVWKYVPFQRMWTQNDSAAFACYHADGGYDMNGDYTPSVFVNKLTIHGLSNGIQYLYLK